MPAEEDLVEHEREHRHRDARERELHRLCVVARRFELDQPTDDHMIAASLPGIRKALIRMGLVCLTRNPEDEPHIVETWL